MNIHEKYGGGYVAEANFWRDSKLESFIAISIYVIILSSTIVVSLFGYVIDTFPIAAEAWQSM